MTLGTQGISPPNVCTKETLLLGIYAMLTHILITFLRNANLSNVFPDNSSVYGNVLRTCLLMSLCDC